MNSWLLTVITFVPLAGAILTLLPWGKWLKLDKAGEQVIAGKPEDLARKVREDHARWAAFLKELPTLKVE